MAPPDSETPRPPTPADQALEVARVVAIALGRAVVAVARWLRARVFSDDNLEWLAVLLADLVLATGGMFRHLRLPTRVEVLDFFGNRLIATAAGWAAAMFSARLVDRWFERRGLLFCDWAAGSAPACQTEAPDAGCGGLAWSAWLDDDNAVYTCNTSSHIGRAQRP